MTTETVEAPAAQPQVKGGVSPYLTVDGAAKASAFYQAAFGAEEVSRMGNPDGKFMHIHLYINDGSVMLSDAFPEHGHPWVPPAGFMLTLEVDDADAWAQRAIKAGAEVVNPIADMFWGARWGTVRDPFGVEWAFNTPKR
ncbi:MAG: Glyoxalase/bleomycin resistance protein/dioxygenase [Phenylobacterium sp.]|nr:Glyoxalase/bleomycin resistance protein/dioxygenase [Phenylobacterium sp.]